MHIRPTPLSVALLFILTLSVLLLLERSVTHPDALSTLYLIEGLTATVGCSVVSVLVYAQWYKRAS